MGRAGYVDDMDDQWALIRWRGAVKSAIRGKRGQAFLAEMLEAMNNLPEKRLVENELQINGEVCAIGSVGAARGIEMQNLDPYDTESIAVKFGIPEALAREIFYMNDEWNFRETPEQRFERMAKWIQSNLVRDSKE